MLQLQPEQKSREATFYSSLGASPKARAVMEKGGPAGGRNDPGSKRSKLDALIDDADGAGKH